METIEEIIINNGDVFRGTVAMFQDCFFANAYPNAIENWCKKEGMKCEIIYKKNSDCVSMWYTYPVEDRLKICSLINDFFDEYDVRQFKIIDIINYINVMKEGNEPFNPEMVCNIVDFIVGKKHDNKD